MDYDGDDRLALICQGFPSGKTMCGKMKTASGEILMRCSRCPKYGWTGRVYCSVACQKSDWPQHRKECDEQRAIWATLPSELRPMYSSLSDWTNRNYSLLGNITVSALDVINQPANVNRLRLDVDVSCRKRTEKSGMSIRIRDFRIVALAEYAGLHLQYLDSLQRSPYTNAVLMCCIKPSMVSVDGMVELQLNQYVLPYVIPSLHMHRLHIRGMPVLNWRETFKARLNKAEIIPDKVTLAMLPAQYIERSPEHEHYRMAMLYWVQPYISQLHTACFLSSRALQRSIQDNIVIIYISERSAWEDSKNQFFAVSANAYSLCDVLPIYFHGQKERYEAQKHQIGLRYYADAAKVVSFVFLQLVGSGISMLLPIVDKHLSPLHAQPSPTPLAAASWRQSLLKELGDNDRQPLSEAGKKYRHSRDLN